MLIQPIDYFLVAWFAVAILSTIWVGWDQFRNNPEPGVMKWGFILVTVYMGPLGLLLYVLADKEPRPGTHEQFTASLWKQGVGSTIHCVAGDAVDRAADPLLPQGRRELLVGPRPRLLVGEDIEQEAEGPHVDCHENEAPLHHPRLGVVPELIPAHPDRGKDGDGEPRHQEVIDRLDQHRTRLRPDCRWRTT